MTQNPSYSTELFTTQNEREQKQTGNKTNQTTRRARLLLSRNEIRSLHRNERFSQPNYSLPFIDRRSGSGRRSRLRLGFSGVVLVKTRSEEENECQGEAFSL